MPLTKSERRQIKHIQASEERLGRSPKKAKKIAYAFVYNRKRLREEDKKRRKLSTRITGAKGLEKL